MELITLLSFGAGQDSTAILYKIIHDPIFRSKYVQGRLLVVMSDTGDEHPETYRHLARVQVLCKNHGIEFFFLDPKMGYHSPSWQDLRSFYKRTKTVGSKAFPKSCSDKLKIVPIYKWLDAFISSEYGYKGGRKQAIKKFAKDRGKIRVILGIAAGEEKRIANSKKCHRWMMESIERIYPLIDEGMDRQSCQDYIKEAGYDVPPPSNCMLCPYMSEIELLWLFRNYPDSFYDWVVIEAAKLEKHANKGEKNFGVWGKKTLLEVLNQAQDKYGHMSDADLHDYKMSHGHCVKSKF